MASILTAAIELAFAHTIGEPLELDFSSLTLPKALQGRES
jgi:hypothetical protein